MSINRSGPASRWTNPVTPSSPATSRAPSTSGEARSRAPTGCSSRSSPLDPALDRLYAPLRVRYAPHGGDEILLTHHNRRPLVPPMRVILQPSSSPEPAAPVRAPPPGPAEVPVTTVQQIFAEHASFVWRTLRRLGVRDADVEDL